MAVLRSVVVAHSSYIGTPSPVRFTIYMLVALTFIFVVRCSSKNDDNKMKEVEEEQGGGKKLHTG